MNYKILMVDDDRELLKMLNQYFTLKNYTVMIAENGIEAMEKISANPDIILLDVNMPGMDGIEVCRRIRDMVSCPIIFLTAKVEEQDRVMGLLSGGDDYVLKPFSLKELDARIIAHLKREERLHRKKEQRFYGELVIDYASKCVHIKGNALELTKLEYEIIEFLSMNPEMVFDKERIYEKIGGYDAEGDGRRYLPDVPRPHSYEMKEFDYHVSEICDFLQTFTVLIVSVAGSIIAVFLFYKHKLKCPIEELELASRQVGRNNLDFHITYENEDEMGGLCKEFERMRGQLAENNQQLWKMLEEEKALRAAIAHDIRSPLSVLEGYQEMLSEYLPKKEINMEQALEMVNESKKQIERMDIFVETMRKMSSLDTRELVAEEITSKQVEIDVRAEMNVFRKKFGKLYELECSETEEKFSGDKEVILEVIENLLSNAFRYAKTKVEMEVFLTCSELQIRIKDDGVGFTIDKQKATELFYQQNVKDSLKHSGMGMYISRLYCEKHGGQLLIENEKQSGAVITAVFHRIA